MELSADEVELVKTLLMDCEDPYLVQLRIQDEVVDELMCKVGLEHLVPDLKIARQRLRDSRRNKHR